MISAQISYEKLTSEKFANSIMLIFEHVRDREIKQMRRDDPRSWKAGKEGISGYKLT